MPPSSQTPLLPSAQAGSQSRSGRRAGFTLVEIALTIGILAFSLVAIMGLLPIGLKASRQSIEQSLALEMSQTVRAYLSSLPYSALPATGSFYFDEEGMLLPAQDDETGARYRVFYTNLAATALPDEQSAPNVRTSQLMIVNLVTNEERTGSFHLPDNGL